jgi:hypothetical protein
VTPLLAICLASLQKRGRCGSFSAYLGKTPTGNLNFLPSVKVRRRTPVAPDPVGASLCLYVPIAFSFYLWHAYWGSALSKVKGSHYITEIHSGQAFDLLNAKEAQVVSPFRGLRKMKTKNQRGCGIKKTPKMGVMVIKGINLSDPIRVYIFIFVDLAQVKLMPLMSLMTIFLKNRMAFNDSNFAKRRQGWLPSRLRRSA